MGFKSRKIKSGYYRRLLRQRFEGRRVICAYGQVAVMGGEVATLRELGCAGVFVLAQGRGTGTVPIDFPHHIVGPQSSATLMDDIRAFERAVRDLPAAAAAALDAFDPDGSAIVVRPLWGTFQEVGGRPVYNPRRPAWIALEDKVVIDALWDRHGVPRAPSRIVAAEAPALRGAHRALDRGAGTVWAGDARDGWHGGGGLTRWVASEAGAARAAAFLGTHCDRVRVMPFLEGIPCSIHGIVGRDGVAALRPVEMITLRDEAAHELRYFGTATLWDPPRDDRRAMRALARRVGAALRDEVDFRGTFTIDGVMTEDGFLPTELNPRYGAGMFRLLAALPRLPMYFVDAALCHDEPWEFRLDALEELIVSHADANRVPTCNAWDSVRRDETEVIELARGSGGELRRVGRGDPIAGTIIAGPSPLGSFLKISFDPETLPAGASIGPHVLEALRFCDRELGTRFGPLSCARSVR
jgi:hypothetical protein